MRDRADAEKAARLAGGIVVKVHLAGEVARRLLGGELDEAKAVPKLTERLSEAIAQAVAPRRQALDPVFAMWGPGGIPSHLINSPNWRDGLSPSRDRYDDPGADYLTKGG
jgi:hypothetical protein